MPGRSRIALLVVLVPALFLPLLACARPSSPSSPGRLAAITLPPGFRIGLFSDRVPGARSMVLGPRGTLFVGTRTEGRVYALRDEDGDGRADRVITLLDGLDSPNGVAVLDGDLYVAEVDRVLRIDAVEDHLDRRPEPVTVSRAFPADRHHGWKFIAFGPDRKLYVPVGAPCNVCLREDSLYASITRMNPDGTGLEVYARGVRNSVGMDWDPLTGDLWFTDNGRDWLGDDRPPDELNRAPRYGMNFGFPYCHGGDIPDPEYGAGHPCSEFTPPAVRLGPHVAALGVCFYRGTGFPEAYRNAIFVAEHGSWNRTNPIGYRIVVVKRDGEGVGKPEPFAVGWLQDGDAWGRPVDVLEMPDGALLVSDDHAGAIYRIDYVR